MEGDRTSKLIHLINRQQEMRVKDAIAPHFFSSSGAIAFRSSNRLDKGKETTMPKIANLFVAIARLAHMILLVVEMFLWQGTVIH
jgi:hypothetical protein